MSRSQWAIAVLVSALIAGWYAYMIEDRAAIRKPEVETQTQAEIEAEPPPLPDLPVERPEKFQLKRLADDPAIEAQLPEPCPLTAVEYRYGSLMTNVLVERFDDNSTSRNVVIGRRRIQVNTDGASNSYHSRVIKADDETIGAINIICNTQTKIFQKTGETKKPVACRQNATSVTDEYAAAYEELRNKNWEDTESGYSIQFDWNVLGKGSQTRPDGPFAPCVKEDGFFVAKTRLRLRQSSSECDASIYPDSNATSAFVLPINWFANYQKKEASPDRFSNFRSGDVVVAYRPGGTNRAPVWVYGVVGDAGPFNKLGEATVAFNRLLQQSTAGIKTYRAALGLDTDKLKPKEIDFIVFEGSARALKRDYSPANIKKVGEKRLAAWMDGALDKAQARFLACAKKLELLPPPQPLPPA
jgi:hypothetical protein